MRYFVFYFLLACSQGEDFSQLYAECEADNDTLSQDMEKLGCDLGYKQGEALSDLVTGGQSQCYDQYSNAYAEIINQALTPNVKDTDASDLFFSDYSDCVMDGFRMRYEETCEL